MLKCFPGSWPEPASCRMEPMTTHFIPKIAVFFTNSSKQSLLLACESWSSGSVLALQMATSLAEWLAQGSREMSEAGQMQEAGSGEDFAGWLYYMFVTFMLLPGWCDWATIVDIFAPSEGEE